MKARTSLFTALLAVSSLGCIAAPDEPRAGIDALDQLGKSDAPADSDLVTFTEIDGRHVAVLQHAPASRLISALGALPDAFVQHQETGDEHSWQAGGIDCDRIENPHIALDVCVVWDVLGQSDSRSQVATFWGSDGTGPALLHRVFADMDLSMPVGITCGPSSIPGTHSQCAVSYAAYDAGPVCGSPCERQSDCGAAEPYCNFELGQCQPTPPQCTTDTDCPDGDTCYEDGYCYFPPITNCKAGWGWFEGSCDNPACVQEACPEGTVIDEQSCECLPSTLPASCSEADTACSPAYPYCNLDTGSCQQEPFQCVTNADCGGDADGAYCHTDGLCHPQPLTNCRPGESWTSLGNGCDTECDPAACPEGTTFVQGPGECRCEPTCQ